MKIAVRMFLSSMAFGVAIAGIYAWTTHEIVGTLLLGLMAVALVVIAIYIRVAESEADLAADKEDVAPSASAGENMGAFSLESYWPIVAAAASVGLVSGLVFLPGVAGVLVVCAGLALLFSLRYLVREST